MRKEKERMNKRRQQQWDNLNVGQAPAKQQNRKSPGRDKIPNLCVWESSRSIGDNVLDCDIVVSKSELKLRYYV